jgi:xylulokinase
MSYVLGVDIGTQAIKGVLLDASLNIAARVYAEHDYIQPKPDWFEHDAEKTWWGGFKTIVHQLLEKAAISAHEIAGVGCSTITPCMLAADEDGNPLRNAILYGVDTRSKQEAKEMTQFLEKEGVSLQGARPLGADHIAPKMLWLKKNEPEAFSKTRRIFQGSGYIAYKLTGRFLLDVNQTGAYAPLCNAERKQWDTEICRLLGFSPDLFPELKSCHEIAGTVTQRASAETGLIQGTPVVLGSGDYLTELISAGGFGPGEVTIIYGTTGVISITLDHPPPMRRRRSSPHPLMENRFSIGGGTATTGALTKWFRDNFGDIEKIMQERTGINAYTLLSRQAEDIPPGSDGLIVLPYFSGERSPIYDSSAKGVIFGMTLYHKRAHLYRALLEGTAYSFRHIFETFADNGLKVSSVIACGGGANSSLWVKIVSDVIGYDQTVPTIPIGSDIGSAYLAAKGTGFIEDIASYIITRRQEKAQIVKADSRNHARYTEFYKIYRNLYENTKSEMHALAKL